MMLNDVLTESTTRLGEVRSFLTMIAHLSPSPRSKYHRNATVGKGLFFVNLYGAYEYTIVTTVQRTVQTFNSMQCTISDCKPVLLSLVLDPKCKAVASVGRNRMWDTRWALFDTAHSSDVAQIDETVIPTDGQNLKYPQLCSIWTTFCLSDPVLPRPALQGRISELVENRNAIAHGREAAATIGSRYSISELQTRLSDIDEVCTYVVQTFDDYLVNGGFLR